MRPWLSALLWILAAALAAGAAYAGFLWWQEQQARTSLSEAYAMAYQEDGKDEARSKIDALLAARDLSPHDEALALMLRASLDTSVRQEERMRDYKSIAVDSYYPAEDRARAAAQLFDLMYWLNATYFAEEVFSGKFAPFYVLNDADPARAFSDALISGQKWSLALSPTWRANLSLSVFSAQYSAYGAGLSNAERADHLARAKKYLQAGEELLALEMQGPSGAGVPKAHFAQALVDIAAIRQLILSSEVSYMQLSDSDTKASVASVRKAFDEAQEYISAWRGVGVEGASVARFEPALDANRLVFLDAFAYGGQEYLALLNKMQAYESVVIETYAQLSLLSDEVRYQWAPQRKALIRAANLDASFKAFLMRRVGGWNEADFDTGA